LETISPIGKYMTAIFNQQTSMRKNRASYFCLLSVPCSCSTVTEFKLAVLFPWTRNASWKRRHTHY
jgi:hypothetical protein